MTRDESNRRIAEALGWKAEQVPPNGMFFLSQPDGISTCYEDTEDLVWARGLDFYTDEAANAMLLEAMPSVSLHFNSNASAWVCSPDLWNHGRHYLKTESNDRKAAIAEAFLTLIESGWRKP